MKWSDEEEKILRENTDKTAGQLQKLLPNRSLQAIKTKSWKIRIRKPYRVVPRVFELNDFDLGVLVGLLEGEGSIGISRRYNPETCIKRCQLYPLITIGNNEPEILEFPKEKLGIGYIAKRSPHWRITGQSTVSSLLKVVAPRLLTPRKRKSAQLVLEFCERRMDIRKAGRFARYDRRDWEIWEELKELQKKGGKLREVYESVYFQKRADNS